MLLSSLSVKSIRKYDINANRVNAFQTVIPADHTDTHIMVDIP